MAQTKAEYDAFIKWHSSGNSVESDAVTERPSDGPQLEMAVEDVNINATSSVDNQQAYMFISDPPELPSLGAGIFGSESLTDGSAATEDQPNNGVLSSETDLQSFGSRTEPSDSGAGDQTRSDASAAAGPSSKTTADAAEKTENPHPLGSSQNPIRIIQQGNKYTSMQELSPEQLNQIMQVFLSDCEFSCRNTLSL